MANPHQIKMFKKIIKQNHQHTSICNTKAQKSNFKLKIQAQKMIPKKAITEERFSSPNFYNI